LAAATSISGTQIEYGQWIWSVARSATIGVPQRQARSQARGQARGGRVQGCSEQHFRLGLDHLDSGSISGGSLPMMEI
jgi:hypothetical protein